MTDNFFKKFISHIKAWEGKLGGSPNDTGAINNGGYAPGTQYHTSVGVTWGTYTNFCRKNGYPIKVDRWLKMPSDLWQKILKTQFMDQWDLKNLFLINTKLACYIIEVAWMSGNGGAESFFASYQRYKGIVDNNITKKEIVSNFIDMTLANEIDWKDLLNYRMEYFKNFSNYETYKNGWNNRTKAFAKL